MIKIYSRIRNLTNFPLYGLEDVNELSKLETVCDSNLFKIRIANKNLLRILVNCSESYKDVISAIRTKGLIGHTFTPKGKKAYRIVIKKLHYTTPHSEIIDAIEATGNKVRPGKSLTYGRKYFWSARRNS
ncbi:unnamed protein product [Leptosia nina]|uniref:Homing endonuclease LAGLIDADG domain-containing protein n=1 Tax=Leptosia nina TaxID=320188 RepID=A0AAV1JGW4_9NEOP